jgi:hypothetical protein
MQGPQQAGTRGGGLGYQMRGYTMRDRSGREQERP